MESTHRKSIGYLLWIFGFTGSHRFYYGRPISGVIWFLTGGLFLIGWIVDLFLIPGMDRKADFRYKTGEIDYSVAWILQTFLGYLGIHRMYMGKWLTGLLYLVTGGLRLLHPEHADHRAQRETRGPRDRGDNGPAVRPSHRGLRKAPISPFPRSKSGR
jgi:TM2 domain-containing membrane protein YozV